MKHKKGELSPMIFIPIVIAVILLGVIFGFINTQRSTTPITDDQFTMTNGTCIELTDQCIVGITSIENATNSSVTIDASNYTLCIATGSTGDNDGVIFNLNTGLNAGWTATTVNATYTERSCNQVTGFAGTLVDYIPILLALALLVGMAVYIK